jgi:hypothetical protein
MTHKVLETARRTLLALSATLLVMVGPAWAIPHITFDDVLTSGGDISFSGNLGDPLVGSDIVFDFVQGIDTVGDDLFCGDCLLDFTTGGLVATAGDLHIFGGGGSYVLTGTLFDNAGLMGIPVASGVLVEGVFDNATADLDVDDNTILVTGRGTDTKHPDLAAHFGLENPFLFAQTEITGTDSVIGPPDPGEGGARSFSAVTINADLDNFPDERDGIIPEPTTLLLLGTGLAGLGIWHRRSSGRRS